MSATESTGPHLNATVPDGSAGGAHTPQAAAGQMDVQLIEQTKHQIRSIVQEIGQLAQSDIPLAEFYDGFLTRVVSALAAEGGALWTVDANGQLHLQYQVNLSKTQLTEDDEGFARHTLLLDRIVQRGEPMLVPPKSGSPDVDEPGNPTDLLLVLAPLQSGGEAHGVVEIFQRPGTGPTTQRGYLRFLCQMCDLAGDFLKNRRLRHFSHRQVLWESLEQFIRAAYADLDPEQVAYVIANEGRRLIQCDRVSVAIGSGRSLRIKAVSGVDRIDTRAESVRLLGNLTAAVLRTGETFWYAGDSSNIAPEIERPLHAHLDESHARVVAVVPLCPRAAKEDGGPDGNHADSQAPIGALIVEKIKDGRVEEGFSGRVEAVADHGGAAMANAIAHHSLFLLPLWRTLGKARWLVRARNLPKTAIACVVASALLAVMFLVPADFELEGRGTLEPRDKHDIYAAVDGVVTDVAVEHGSHVEPNQIVARLRNTDVDVAIVELLGKQMATQEEILSLQRDLLSKRIRDPDQHDRMSGRLIQLRKSAENLAEQLALYRRKEEQLVIRSPMRGEIVTWKTHDRLGRRPVRTGQVLMTVVDPAGPWELLIDMPERRMGFVERARRESDEPLKVAFQLASNPGDQFEGRVIEVRRVADTQPDGETTVRIRVGIDKDRLPELRPGVTATAKVDCGRQSIGYVYFHDVISFVQTKILFLF